MSINIDKFIHPADTPLDIYDPGDLTDVVLVAGTEAFGQLRSMMLNAGYPDGTPLQQLDWHTLETSRAVKVTFARGKPLPITVLPHTD